MLDNLDRLKVFYHVFTQTSVVAAAEILHVSQSAVSQALQKLEREIGTPLFTRLHKQLVPTAAGEGLYRIVQPFMVAVGTYLKDLEMGKNHPVGELRIGAPPEFGKTYLPPIVAGFREQYQAVTFTLEFGNTEKLLPLLKKGRLDFAFVDVFLTRATHIGSLDIYHFDPVVEEEVILACSRQYYKESVRGDLSLSSLAQQNFISYSKDLQAVKQWFRYHFSKPNIRVHEVLTVDSHEAVISAIEHHIGMGVVASHLISNELHNGSIVQISSSRPEIMNTISLIHLQDKIPTHTEKIFVRFMVETIRSVVSKALATKKTTR